jgi:hypothetical protein
MKRSRTPCPEYQEIELDWTAAVRLGSASKRSAASSNASAVRRNSLHSLTNVEFLAERMHWSAYSRYSSMPAPRASVVAGLSAPRTSRSGNIGKSLLGNPAGPASQVGHSHTLSGLSGATREAGIHRVRAELHKNRANSDLAATTTPISEGVSRQEVAVRETSGG